MTSIRKQKKAIKREILHGRVTGPLLGQTKYPDHALFFASNTQRTDNELRIKLLRLNRKEYAALANLRGHANIYLTYERQLSDMVNSAALKAWVKYLCQFNDDWHIKEPTFKVKK